MTDTSVFQSDSGLRRVLCLVLAVAALALVLLISASVPEVRVSPPDPRAVVMLEQGQSAIEEGEINQAIDAFEAALALDPGYPEAVIALADATRIQGLPGKSIGYYRQILRSDPMNVAALSGEGQALVARGAMDQAERNLSLLESVCGDDCEETRVLRIAILEGPPQRVAVGDSREESTSN